MTRKPAFWIVFAALAVLAAAAGVKYFPLGFPVVSVDIRMDRVQALNRARALAAERHWGPAGSREAASFNLDDELQSFVELEAGGPDAFTRLLKEGLVSPYTWEVRLFKEHEPNETRVLFTPAGAPYGFSETLAEDAPGAALSKDAALRIAEDAARAGWSTDFGAFKLIEASQEVRPGKRVDHSFVYERPDVRLGQGRYRLRLVVSGDRLTGLMPFVKVPEAFNRRYADMRSRNDAVAAVADFFILLVYGSGIVIGLFFLLRQRYVLWKAPLKWAGLVGVLLFAAQLARWPLAWMEYPTAESAGSFAIRQVQQALLVGLGYACAAALAFIGAETFSRRAFPHHLQLWRVWSLDVARSRTVLGLTVTAYLLLGFFIAWEVGLYAFAQRHLGWWSPSSALGDPNVIATYFPWLTAIAIPLEAGMLEETLFRAVPLSLAALLGRRFGRPRLWIGATLVLQAVVFGAAHANYPAQPAWARLFEIAVPFCLVGAMYLAYGLLPAIILHYAVDVAAFSLPIFVSSGPGIVVDRIIIVALALVPLWVVLYARLRRGAGGEAPAEASNGAWVPPEAPPRPVIQPEARATTVLGATTRGVVIALGVVGLLAWVLVRPPRNDAPAVQVSSDQARLVARSALEARGVRLEAPWKELRNLGGGVTTDDRFVWQEGGPDVYRSIVGKYLDPPHWMVRFARFEGADVAARAEEYRIQVDGQGVPFRIHHVLPEDRAGKELGEAEARALAYSTLASTFGLDAAHVTEVSAEPSQKPARRDWRFVFSDPAVRVGGKGEARLAVAIAGDEVADAYRFVHVPEEWERAEQNRAAQAGIVRASSLVLVIFAVLAGVVIAVVRWSRGRFATRTFVVFFPVLAVLFLVMRLDDWPAMSSQFLTNQPWALQAGILLASLVIGSGAYAAAWALIVGLLHRAAPPQPRAPRSITLLTGVALACAWAGLAAVGRLAGASREPLWASFDGAAAFAPALAVALSGLFGWVQRAALLLLLLVVVDGATRGFTRRRPVFAAVMLLAGLLAAGANGMESLSSWLLRGLALGLILLASYVWVLRHQLALVPVVAAATFVLSLAREATFRAFPGALVGDLLAVVAVAVLAVLWASRLEEDARAGVAAPGSID